MIIWHLL